MSRRPNWSTVASMSCLASSRRETSVRWSTAFPPIASTARTAACPAGSLRSAITTCAPALARATAMDLPIPLPAPVTTPTVPSKLTIDSPPLWASALEMKEAFGVLAKDLLLDSLRHIAPRAPASDVVFFCGGVAVREIGGAHEAILSHMLQEIIKILVSFAVHERPSRTEVFLRVVVVAAVNGIIDGASLPWRENYGGRLYPAPDLLHRIGDPGGTSL